LANIGQKKNPFLLWLALDDPHGDTRYFRMLQPGIFFSFKESCNITDKNALAFCRQGLILVCH
jgi:hypothetical protein